MRPVRISDPDDLQKVIKANGGGFSYVGKPPGNIFRGSVYHKDVLIAELNGMCLYTVGTRKRHSILLRRHLTDYHKNCIISAQKQSLRQVWQARLCSLPSLPSFPVRVLPCPALSPTSSRRQAAPAEAG